MATNSNDFLEKYNQIPNLTAIEILKKFGIITKCTPLTIDTYVEGIDTSSSELDDDDLLGDGEAEKDPVLTQFAQNTKDNVTIRATDFIDKSDTGLEPLLAKSAISDNFHGVVTTSNRYNNHHVLVTQPKKSYTIFINMENIPHLLGLPNANAARTSRTGLINYLNSIGVNANNYFDLICAMLRNPELKGEWFDSLFLDLSDNPEIEFKDNTDKIGYKRAILQTLLDSIVIGDNMYPGSNLLMIYESDDKERIMSIVNIPNTDGYLGLICIRNRRDENTNNYTLFSVVAFNERDIKPNIRKTGVSFTIITNKNNKEANITDVEKEKIVKSQSEKQKSRTKNKTGEIIYSFDDRYYDGTKKESELVEKLKKADNQIRLDTSETNNKLAREIIKIVNSGYDKEEFKTVLPKFLINLILTSGTKYESFIYNILIIMENCKFDSDTLSILNEFYTMKKEDFEKLISNEDEDNEYEISMAVSEDKVGIYGSFSYMIGKNNKTIPFKLEGDISDIKTIEKKFNKFMSDIYESFVFDDKIVLNVRDNKGIITNKAFLDYSKTLKNLIGLRRFAIASLEEIANNSKNKNKKH